MPGGDLRQRIASLFELPPDVVLDVPRVTMLGDMQLAIENHRSLLEYTDVRVAIGVPGGRLAVLGRDLTIGTVSAEMITVMGKIRSLCFESA